MSYRPFRPSFQKKFVEKGLGSGNLITLLTNNKEYQRNIFYIKLINSLVYAVTTLIYMHQVIWKIYTHKHV